MRIYLILLLLATQLLFSQKEQQVSTYKYGYNGMELIVKQKSETVIVSTYNSKKVIKDEVAQKVYDYFKSNTIKTGDTINITANDACVTGKCFITKKGKLTSINFYYETIKWNNGLTEVYKKT